MEYQMKMPYSYSWKFAGAWEEANY